MLRLAIMPLQSGVDAGAPYHISAIRVAERSDRQKGKT